MFPERWSAGIVASVLAVLPYLAFSGVSFGLFWFQKRDFEEIGGFDGSFVSVEDLDFARRLKRHGRRNGRVWGTLMRTPLVTSCRKFDRFGDWFVIKAILRNPLLLRSITSATPRVDPEFGNRLFYDFEH